MLSIHLQGLRSYRAVFLQPQGPAKTGCSPLSLKWCDGDASSFMDVTAR